MKILFLDVDGVLNSQETFQRNHDAWLASGELEKHPKVHGWPMGHLDSELISRLNTVCAKTDCHIVLSSAWRIIAELPDFRGWLTQKGFKYSEKIIDRTANLSVDNRRGAEIQDWIDKNKEKVSLYAIVDDDSFDIVPVHPNNFVHTSFMEGLQDPQVDMLVNMLNK